MKVKLCLSVMVFIISQFYFLKDAAAWKSKSYSHHRSKGNWNNGWDRCKNDSDCGNKVNCYAEKCRQVSYGYKYHHSHRTVGVCKTVLVPAETCTSGQMYCQDRTSCATKCNKVKDCVGGEDELGCPECDVCKNTTEAETCSKGQLYCQDRVTCATKCDNIKDCDGGEDELNCTDCDDCTNATGCNDRYAFLAECTEYKEEFGKIPGYYLAVGLIGALIPGQTSDSCEKLCLNNTACINFQMSTTGECFLHSTSLRDALLASQLISTPGVFTVFPRECKVC